MTKAQTHCPICHLELREKIDLFLINQLPPEDVYKSLKAELPVFISPYQIRIHFKSGHHLNEPDAPMSSESVDKHETISSRRDELKKKLDQVSSVYDREIQSPTNTKALKDIAQEFRMLIAQLNTIDQEIESKAKEEAKNAALTDDGRYQLNPHLENASGAAGVQGHHYMTRGEVMDMSIDESGHVSTQNGPNRGRGPTMQPSDFDASLRVGAAMEHVEETLHGIFAVQELPFSHPYVKRISQILNAKKQESVNQGLTDDEALKN